MGMLDSHLEPKPFDFAKPEKFRAFFKEQLVLVGLEKYTYEEGETLFADVQAHQNQEALQTDQLQS